MVLVTGSGTYRGVKFVSRRSTSAYLREARLLHFLGPGKECHEITVFIIILGSSISIFDMT